METGIKNFPAVYYLSLKESIDRQHDLESQFLDRGISYRMIEGYDGRLVDIRDQLNITGSFVGNHNIPSEVLSVGVSHLRMIYRWYKDTNEEYALFCEDDVNFSLVDHWNLDFKDLIRHLPKDWKVIQMSLIKETPVNWSDMRMRRKKWNDWSCCAYLINREYARQVVEDYYDEDTDTYTLDIRGTTHKPLPENLIYPGDYRRCYVFPFFTENRKHNSTLNRNQEGEYDKIRAIQNQSSEFITTWWKENGKDVNIKELVSMIDKIPVIGAPVVNSTYWISRLIMSVDYPVENFVIINNNGRGEIDEELDRLAQMNHKFIDNIKVVHMPANIGCAGAWNLIIKCYMLSQYWIIVNDDVSFGPGLLKEMVDTLNADPMVGMIHPNAGDFGIGAWDLFLIRENVVKIFGLFDENTYPAYCEDADYIMRMQHRPIRKVVGLKNKYMHGHDDSTMYYQSGSQTEKNEEGLKEKLDQANKLNIEYLTKKWGEGWRSLSPNVDPFEGEDAPISITTWDLEFVRQKHMGF
jgi:GR25 family glycosyltransferase involved in LPS biosynthesis